MAKKPKGKRARNALHYARFLARRDVTVKHVRADMGQKRVIFRALHEARDGLGAGDRVMVAVVMCMTQESVCRALSGGDRDSVGPFQQRAPWGSAVARKNAARSCHAFLKGGAAAGTFGWDHYHSIKSVPANLNLSVAIQDVQRSAYPDAYAAWETEATATVNTWLRTRV